MPYIPKEHEKYNLLPLSRKNGGEVFEYPSLWELDSLVKPFDIVLEPYGYESYEQYYKFLDNVIEQLKNKVPKIEEKINEFKQIVQEENIKEQWSVCRYIGETTDSMFGLTKGNCYYWPASFKNPFFSGIIDDEEFTSYQYNTSPKNWEILEDPTGMAKKAIKDEVGEDFEITQEIIEQLKETSQKIGTPNEAITKILNENEDSLQ